MTPSNPNPYKLRTRRKALRKVPRGAVSVECRKDFSELGKSFPARFLDVSEGGLRLTVHKPMWVGEKVEISIKGPELIKPIKCLANVVWAVLLEDKSYCVGLEFHQKLRFVDVLKIAKPVDIN